ncbi:MAG: 1-deoxy-D-xylulose-5-phosphate reductoisomerase [Clostridia bacterium]|nr:1-deoxy-D-xylulose-5-phosphate reductoisomerase [Clostridia bacterium]
MKISVLGSTGSIGTQTLNVVDNNKDLEVLGLSGNSNIQLLEQQARKYRPKVVAVADEKNAALLKIALSDTPVRVAGGEEGLCEVSALNEIDTVVTSVVGIAGLVPTLFAIENGKNIALANKETLVTAGDIVINEAKKQGVSILPVDSEHSAIFQCIGNHESQEVKKLIITASGGSQYGKTRDMLKDVTVKEALNHPNWDMGQKITVDSATLMNKGFEVIEAKWLYGVDYDDIEVLVHRQSIVHSMVEFCDNSVIAQLSVPDMRLAIHYALCYPKRVPSNVPPLDLTKIGSLTFEKPDTDTFNCLSLAIDAGKKGGTMPTVLNGADEVAVSLFLQGKIKFLQIAEIVEKAMTEHENTLNPTIDDIIETDREIRNKILKDW